MAGKSYFEKLKDPRWQRKRLEIMQRADFRCECCLDADQPLQIHHGLYRWNVEPWDAPNDTLWCLCEGCHGTFQDHLADLKLEIGRLPPSLYESALMAILDIATIGKYDAKAIAETE